MQEWERLNKSAYDRLNFVLHMDFINDFLKEDIKVFDVGCGAGRYSLEFANKGCQLSILDISDTQLEIAKEILEKNDLLNFLKESYRTSISDMSMVKDESYDITVCYGAPLNYLYDDYEKGIQELYRVTKTGGKVAVSVNSRLGIFRMLYGNEDFNICGFMENAEYWYIDKVLETGNLPEHPEVNQPSRHFFNAKELKALFEKVGFNKIELASSPCIISGLRNKAEELYSNETAWNKVVEIELLTYKNEHLADSGEFLLLRGTK